MSSNVVKVETSAADNVASERTDGSNLASVTPSDKEVTKSSKIRIRLKLPTSTQNRDPAVLSAETSGSAVQTSVEKKRPAKSRKFVKLPIIHRNQQESTHSDKMSDNDVNTGDDDSAAIMAPVSFHSSTAKATIPSKRKANTNKPLKLPPIGSPGLLMSPVCTSGDVKVSSNGLVAPQDVFEHHMALAGYTLNNRTQKPHRGSSVKRVVGDIFDSDIKATLQFPPVIPVELWTKDNGRLARKIASRLEEASTELRNPLTPLKKRSRLLTMRDMAPVSLTIPLPDALLEQRKAYWEQVDLREQAIVDLQLIEEKQKSNDGAQSSANEEVAKPTVPAIPDEPPAPSLTDIGCSAELLSRLENRHPYYPPKGGFVDHLDPNAFHITQGRYFGLTSNHMIDPNFVGPNAPGIAGLQFSAGLATSSNATSANPGITISKMPVYYPKVSVDKKDTIS